MKWFTIPKQYECPHCHKRSITLFDKINIDPKHYRKCRSCGGTYKLGKGQMGLTLFTLCFLMYIVYIAKMYKGFFTVVGLLLLLFVIDIVITLCLIPVEKE